MIRLSMTQCLCITGLILFTTFQTSEAAERPKVGSIATDFSLQTLAGKEVKLSTLNKTGPVVVVVLRGYPGYQCPLCTRQVGELINSADKFSKANANVILIYPGSDSQLTDKAKEFIGKTQLPKDFTLLTDPGYTFTDGWSLRWDAPNETVYPSVFVVGKDGKVQYSHTSDGHGNRAKTSEVLAALNK